MGWGLWPRLKRDWPVEDARCLLCAHRLRAGDKYYLRAGRALHAVCAWREADEAAQPSLPF